MRKLMLATAGLTLSMALSAAAIAQSGAAAAQAQTAPSTATDNNTGMPGNNQAGTMPQMPQTQGDTSNTMSAPGSSSDTGSPNGMSSATGTTSSMPMADHKYPRCSKTVRDECRNGH